MPLKVTSQYILRNALTDTRLGDEECVDVRSIAVDKNKTRQEFAEALVCPATVHSSVNVKSGLFCGGQGSSPSSHRALGHADQQALFVRTYSELLFTLLDETNNVYSFYDLQSRFTPLGCLSTGWRQAGKAISSVLWCWLGVV